MKGSFAGKRAARSGAENGEASLNLWSQERRRQMRSIIKRPPHAGLCEHLLERTCSTQLILCFIDNLSVACDAHIFVNVFAGAFQPGD